MPSQNSFKNTHKDIQLESKIMAHLFINSSYVCMHIMNRVAIQFVVYKQDTLESERGH